MNIELELMLTSLLVKRLHIHCVNFYVYLFDSPLH